MKGSKFTASMLHDLEKGAMVEADHIVGDMIARAKKAGIATPNLRMAYAHLQVYLARRARGGIGKPAGGLERPAPAAAHVLGMSIPAILSLVPRRNHPIAEA